MSRRGCRASALHGPRRGDHEGQCCASAGADRRRRYRGVRQEPRPHGRGRRQGARRLSEAARGRPGQGRPLRRDRPTWSRRSARSPNTGCPIRSARSKLQIAARPRLSRSVGRGGQAPGRRRRPRRSSTPDPSDKRFADPEWSSNQFFDFLKQAYLLTTALGRPSGQGRQGPRPAHPAEGRVLRQADRQRALAVELRADQSGAVARDARLQRREPRARHAHAGRGHRGRRRRSEDPPVRRREIRGRPQPRDHARQGDLPERPDAAHPVRAVDPRRC